MPQEFLSNLKQYLYLYLISYFLLLKLNSYVYKIIIIYLVCEVIYYECSSHLEKYFRRVDLNN